MLYKFKKKYHPYFACFESWNYKETVFEVSNDLLKSKSFETSKTVNKIIDVVSTYLRT